MTEQVPSNEQVVPSPELLREWAKSVDNTMCWGLNAVAAELERLREEVAVVDETSRAAHVAMVKAWQRPAHEPSAEPVAWRFDGGEIGLHYWGGSTPPEHNKDLKWEPLYTRPAPPPCADRREDRAYFLGAKQALAMANQSLEVANKWLADGCGGRASVTKGAG